MDVLYRGVLMQDEIKALFEKYVTSDNKLEDTDELFQSLVAAADQSENPAEFHNISGVGFYEREYFKHAAVLFERAVACSPTNRQYLEHLAISYYRMQLYEMAVDCFQRVNDIDPTDCKIVNNIAMLYMESKQYNNAAHYLEEFLIFQSVNDKNIWKTYVFVLYDLELYHVIVDLDAHFNLAQYEDHEILLTLFYAYYNCLLPQKGIQYGKALLNKNIDINMEIKELEKLENAQTV
mgnify:CR=1 FL=1